MEGLFTVLTEAFADRMAPKLAKISLAAGIYLWLYSRIFSTKNCIGVSVSRLAKIFDKDRRSIQRALSRLVDEGLVSHEVYKHAGGGSVFHLTGVEGETFLSPQNTGRRDKDVAVDEADSSHHGVTGLTQRVRPGSPTTDMRGANNGNKHKSQSPYDYNY